MICGGFEELGLSEEVMGAVGEMGIQVPTEIQCIGVPKVLSGKSVVLGSHTGSGKTLAYLLPLVQVSCCTNSLFKFLLFSGSFFFVRSGLQLFLRRMRSMDFVLALNFSC